MIKQKWPILIFILGLFLPLSYISAGTVLSSYKYVWSNNAGYINFENVTVGDNQLSGFAWSANYGWIKFDPVQGGVSNDGTGNLSGSAWGASLGWIDFDGVSINGSTGKFSGTATGTLVGTINFDCPNYCDVRTDWRQSTTSVVSSGAGSYIANPTLTPKSCIEVSDQPLIIQSAHAAKLIKNTSIGSVIVEVPPINLGKKLILDVIVEPIVKIEDSIIPASVEVVGGLIHDIRLRDEECTPIHSLPAHITIILPIPTNFTDTKNLGAYWFNETNQSWVLIPDAVIDKNKVIINANHLTKFAILALKRTDLQKSEKTASVASLPVKDKSISGKATEESVQQYTSESPQTFIKSVGEKVCNFFKSIINVVVSFSGTLWRNIKLLIF